MENVNHRHLVRALPARDDSWRTMPGFIFTLSIISGSAAGMLLPDALL